jgi:hypothetical protein
VSLWEDRREGLGGELPHRGQRREAPRRAGGRLIRSAAAAALLAIALPAAADAQGTGDVPNFPELLPPNPFNSSQTVWPGFDVCPGGEQPTCPQRVILEMYERWRPLSQDCDHRAVFALTYLRTTEEYFRTVTETPTFFDDGRWVTHEDAVFAQFYFNAEDAHRAGEPIPEAWRIAFDAAGSRDVTGAGDLFLGMNAHINRDLAYTLAAVGLVAPDGSSRKADHDRVNLFLNNIADPLQDELGARYDPYFITTDAGPSPFDEIAILQTVRGWRQGAWQNAENLVNATTEDQREQAAAGIESYSTAAAQSIVAGNTIPGYGEVRDEWCREHNPPSARLEIKGKLRGVVHRKRLPVMVWADGPARFGLEATLNKPQKGPRGSGATLRLTRPAEADFATDGWQRATLRLTRAGRRKLSRLRTADVTVTLDGPYGFGIHERATLQRHRRHGSA